MIRFKSFTIWIFGGIVAFTLVCGCTSTCKRACTEANAALERIHRLPPPDTVKAADLDRVPPPVKRYLLKAGVVGKEQVRTFRGRFTGEMKVGGEKSNWTKVRVTQYSFVDSTLTRIFYIESRMFGLLPVVGRDKLEAGRGNMLIRVGDMVTVVNQTGPTMDRSALVTFLNDMAMFPAALLDRHVSWEPVTDSTARATLTDCGISVSAMFMFDRSGDLVDFYTDDRTYDDGRGDVRKARWRTPLRNFREFAGVRIFSEGEAVWDFGDRQFPYARFKLQDVGYNTCTLYGKGMNTK
jgi:hypothetical protein